MARYRLLTDHYLAPHYLERGTEIGDGTPWPFDGRPSQSMEPLDEEAKAAVAREGEKLTVEEVLSEKPKSEGKNEKGFSGEDMTLSNAEVGKQQATPSTRSSPPPFPARAPKAEEKK